MRICVFGANGQTGRLLVRQALDEGHRVTAFTRHPDAFPIRGDGLRVEAGDVSDADAVQKAVTGQDAVLSSLGARYGREPITVYSQGAVNILAAMARRGAQRLVAVSSSAVEEDPNRLGGLAFRKVLQPYLVNRIGRTLYDDMRRMEAVIRASTVDWTIIRPSGLYGAPEVSAYEVADRYGSTRFTARRDLADCMLREAGPGGHHRKVIAVVTTEGTPSILSIIWNEGIKKH
jgi:uncharacterized protein YbjT (DUF2867 family)